MSVHLVGGGWSPEHAASVYAPFIAEAAEAAGRDGADRPRVAVLLVAGDDAAEQSERWTAVLEGIADL
ncbi:MAG TPA: hypothetical protein VFS72_15390, partial [Agromyces sp.]|nr:hypothetical protein [Agromyces sp.]